jgi:hypothetical protein
MRLICALLLLLSFKSNAQYPFENYPAITYKKIKITQGYTVKDTTFIASVIYKNYNISFTQSNYSDSAKLTLKYKGRLVHSLKIESINPLTLNDTLYAADIDGNGNIDFKLIFYNNGSGLAGSLLHKLYLFNNGHNRFNSFYYTDFSSFVERDMNKDGNYEIIGDVLTRYKGHSYWTFNLYNYSKKGKLLNVNQILNYPILVQYLNRDNYQITNKLSRKEMKFFTLSYPDYFKSKTN